jgi:hypothetical protein
MTGAELFGGVGLVVLGAGLTDLVGHQTWRRGPGLYACGTGAFLLLLAWLWPFAPDSAFARSAAGVGS